jgi:hypothetical protein
MSASSPVASVRSVLADESANEPDLVRESTHLEALAIEDDDDDDVIPGFPKGRFWLHSVESRSIYLYICNTRSIVCSL